MKGRIRGDLKETGYDQEEAYFHAVNQKLIQETRNNLNKRKAKNLVRGEANEYQEDSQRKRAA